MRTLSVQPWDFAPIPTAVNFFRQELVNLVLPGALGSTVVSTLAGGGAMQAIGRNPDASGKIVSNMILAIVFTEALGILALVVAFIIKFV